MDVVNPRAALLSNLEVLHLLRELEADHLASQKSALKIKKEEEQAGSQNPKNPAQNDQISENLRTIEVEASSPVFLSFPAQTDRSSFCPGYSISHSQLPAVAVTVRSWRPKTRQGARTLWVDKGGKTPNRQSRPNRTGRTLHSTLI